MDAKKRGVLIAIKDTISFNLLSEHFDPMGRYLIIVCDFNNVRYTLVNVYVPNRRQIHFLNGLMSKSASIGQVVATKGYPDQN